MIAGLLGGLAGLFCLYLFLVAPCLHRGKAPPGALLGQRYFAHRGLHDGSVPENSLAAFRMAAEKGYGIEWDVHLSRDGKMFVFHDFSLLRMCGVDRLISDMTEEEIRVCRLQGGSEGIPSLDEALKTVNGRVPLIIEMKADGKLWDTALAQKLFDRMQSYPGRWCVESFDPFLVRWYKKHAPDIVRGQLAYDPRYAGEKRSLIYHLAARLLFNFLSRPHFIAYGWEGDRNASLRLMRALFRPVMAAWTVRTPQASKDLQNRYDAQIFEAFDPSSNPKEPVFEEKE